MPRIDVSDIDLTRELRLRRWARENYVATEDRDAEWHPVVLHEMALIDEERQAHAADEDRNSRFVPLMPGNATSGNTLPEDLRIHSTEPIRQPRMTRETPVTQSEVPEWMSATE
jgi:hypothetical protein